MYGSLAPMTALNPTDLFPRPDVTATHPDLNSHISRSRRERRASKCQVRATPQLLQFDEHGDSWRVEERWSNCGAIDLRTPSACEIRNIITRGSSGAGSSMRDP